MVVFILARRVIFRLFLSVPISFLHLDSRLLDISDDLLSDTPTGGGGSRVDKHQIKVHSAHRIFRAWVALYTR